MRRFHSAEKRFFQEQDALRRLDAENRATARTERSMGIRAGTGRSESEIAAQMFRDGQAQRPPRQGKSAANKRYIMRDSEHMPGIVR